MVVADNREGLGLLIGLQVEGLLSIFGLCDNVIFFDDEAAARVGGDEHAPSTLEDEHVDDLVAVGQVNHEADWFAVSASARQLVHTDSVEPAIGGKGNQLVGGFRPQRKL